MDLKDRKDGWVDTNKLSTVDKREACNERGGKMRMFWSSFSACLPEGDYMLVSKGRIVAGFFKKPEGYPFLRKLEAHIRKNRKIYNL